MSWGTGPWGITPWGGGEPSALGDINITTVRFITPIYIRLHLNTQVIATGSYLDPENYVISLRSDSPVVGDQVRPIRVFAPTQDVLVADYIYLETTPHTLGAYYEVNFTELQTLDGVSGFGVNLETPYQARTTKTMSQLKSLPAHFDKRLDALLHAVATAISLQDDTIGGSRSDEFP